MHAAHGEMVECSRAVVAAAERRGVAVDGILRAFGTTRAQLDDPDQRIACAITHGLWEALIAATGDPDLPLHAVELSPFGSFQVIDFLGANGGTIGGGLQALARYFHVIHPEMRMTLHPEGDGHRVEVEIRGHELGGDFALAMTLTRFAAIASGGCTPQRVHLRRGPTQDAALARRLFGRHITWQAAENAAWLDQATWSRPLPASNPALARVLEQHARSFGPPTEAPTLTERVREQIRRHLPAGRAEIERIAPDVGLSVRTLQRRLASEGQSFLDLVEAERRGAAERHLADPRLTLVEVALLTGYSDETAFHRAFQRWHGTSPHRWRRGQAA